jgi:hypothetical protein
MGVGRVTGLSVRPVMALRDLYVDVAIIASGLHKEVRRLEIEETSRANGHDYVSLLADAEQLRVLFDAGGRKVCTVGAFVAKLGAHHGEPRQIESIGITTYSGPPSLARGYAQLRSIRAMINGHK